MLWDVAQRRQSRLLPEAPCLCRVLKTTFVALRAPVALFAGHSAGIAAAAWSPDSNVLASGSYDTTIRVWDVWSQSTLHTLDGHTSAVLSITFNADGTLLASCASDGTLRMWDVRTGNLLQVLRAHSTAFLNQVAFSSMRQEV
ncbi:hypothetical protein FOA52_016156 [Chlamydomonas sp. UWO 241]|nr:hypothetical protein FOA52_016156 [Chlamydomonas sp. UWO 241]